MELMRKRTDRDKELSPVDIVYPPDMDTYSSHLVSDLLAFNVDRKLRRLKSAVDSIVENSHKQSIVEFSDEQLDALERLSSLIVADTRLCDYLPDKVIPRLVEFLDTEEDLDIEQDSGKRTVKFQYSSTLVLANVVCSKKGTKVMNLAVPSLLKLLSSQSTYVKIQALETLTSIACKFPEYCNTLVQKGVLEHLEPLLATDLTSYAVLKSGGELLIAFCQVNPSLPSDQIQKIVGIICTAIHHEYESSLIPISVALSILSDRKQVVIGTEFTRLLRLIRDPAREIAMSSLRIIGNYVRWGNDEHIAMMIDKYLLLNLVEMFYHKHEIVRKEACWIISNINAIANHLQIKVVIQMQYIVLLVEVIRKEKSDLKMIAANAISNAILGSNEEQCRYFREKCVPLLERIVIEDLEVHVMISSIYSNLRKKESLNSVICIYSVEEKYKVNKKPFFSRHKI